MYRIIDKRSTGKTLRLFLLAKEYNGVVVCGNPQAMRQKAKAYNLNDIQFEDYVWLLRNVKDSNKPIFIDELDSFLTHGINRNIQGYTISDED